MNSKITVIVPARIHMTLLDSFSTQNKGPNGGGITFSTNNIYTKCTVRLQNNNEILFENEKNLLVEHFLKKLSKKIGFNKGLLLNIDKIPYEHSGLSSNAGMLLSSALALNAIMMHPLSPRKLRMYVANNYLEVADGKLVDGLETGCSGVAGLYGGLSIVGNDAEIIDNMQFKQTHYAVIFIRKDYQSFDNEKILKTYGKDENFNNPIDMLDDFQQLSYKSYKIFYQIIPAMRANKIEKLSKHLFDLNFLKSPVKTLYQRDALHYYAIFQILKKCGAAFVGVSSCGPSFFATSTSRETITNAINQVEKAGYNYDEVVITEIGGKATINGEGWKKKYHIGNYAKS